MKLRAFLTVSLSILISNIVGGSQAAPAIQLDVVPLGPLVATGGGHYEVAPLITKDGSRAVVVASKGSRVQAYVDGVPGPIVRDVRALQGTPISGSGSPAFSSDQKRVAYIVGLDGGKQAVVVDSTQSPAYDSVAWLGFAPVGHHFAYIAQRAGKYFVVDNGQAGLIYDGIQPSIVTFSPDGTHCAYVAFATPTTTLPPVQQHGLQPQRFRVVLDGKEQKHFEPAGKLTFSNDGKHFAYLAGTDGLALTRAVIDGQEGPVYGLVNPVIFSDDGSRSAYIATKDMQHLVVVDTGKEGPAYNDIRNLVVSHDGQRVAYVGVNTTSGQMQSVVVDNGKPGIQYVSCENLQFSPDGKTLIYTAHAAQGEFLVSNGGEAGPFTAVNSSIVFSEDSKHWAVCVDPPTGGHAVVEDGKTIPLNPAVTPGPLTFQTGTDRLILKTRSAYSGGPVTVEVGAPADSIGIVSTLIYSPNLQHCVKIFTAGSGTSEVKEQIAIDGQPASGNSYMNINHVAISDDGKHVAFIGTYYGGGAGASTHAIFDGKEGPAYQVIDDLLLSPDGQHVAYVAEDHINHAGNWFVVLDGLAGPALQDILPLTSYQDGDHRLRFAPDGSLHFMALLNGQLHRCTYSAGVFKSLPSIATTEAAKPGLRILHSFTGTAVQMILAPDETLFGISTRDGKFNKGTLFQMKTDGTGFTVLHDFFGGDLDGENPLSLLRSPDGTLFGTLDRKVFRYDPKSQQYSILNINTRDVLGGYFAGFAADGAIVGITGVLSGAGSVFSMMPDGSNYVSVDNSQFSKTLRMYSQIVPAKDGSFFAISFARTGNCLVKFKKITDAANIVHKFVDAPTDGTNPESDLTPDSKGNFYGTTVQGGMSQKGVIYRIDADGSNYQIIYNPDQFTFPKRFAVGNDGTLYAVSREGLSTLAPGAPQPTIVLPFQNPPDFGYIHTPCLFLHDGAVYGLANKAIYKVALSGSNVAASAPPTVTIQPIQPAPLAADAIVFTDP